MKKLLFSFLMVSVCFLGNAQLDKVTVEQVPLTGMIGTVDFTGYTNYRLFAEVTDGADAVTAVIGNDVCPTDITTTTLFHRTGAITASSPTGDNIGAFFLTFPGFEDIRFSSCLGIGTAAGGYLGIPTAEDSDGSLNAAWGPGADGLVPAVGANATVLVGGFETGFQFGGSSFAINSFAGGGWFSTPGGSNSLGLGVNNSIFLGSFTTDGDFSYNITVGVQDDLLGSIDYASCSESEIEGLIFPAAVVISGCTDGLACNYDSLAVNDDGSCVFAVGGFDCNGDCLAGVGLSIVITADEYSAENTWSLTEDGVEVAFGGGDDQNLSICVDPTLCYEFTMADSYGDGQFGSLAFGGVDGTTTVTLDGTEVFSSTGNWGAFISGNFGVCVIEGCTDPLAANYDPNATLDDGSCIPPAVANDAQAGAEALTMTAYGTCTSISGTTVGATDSPESTFFDGLYGGIGGPFIDVWYEIVPTEPGVRIEVITSSQDCMLELYDGLGSLVASVDEVFTNTGEILFSNVIPGDSYFLSVQDFNNVGGAFEICAQDLPDARLAVPNQGQVYTCGTGGGLSSSVYGAASDWTFDDGVNAPITVSTASSYLHFVLIPGLLPATDYDVTINTFYDGFAVNAVITDEISVAPPSTGLKTQYINSTVSLSGNAYIRCLQNTACGYESFDWRITDVNTGVVSNISTAGDLLFLPLITDIAYGAEYTAEIAVVYNGGVVTTYGAAQTFFTGDAPVIQLRTIFNSANTALALSQDIQATPKVFLASDYEWSVERTDVTELAFVYTRGLAVRVARVGDMPLSAGGTYNLRVRAIVPGVVTVFGPIEEVVVLGGAGMVQNDEETSPEILEETVVKDNVISAAVTMYPNPAKDFVTLNITGIAEGTDKVLVAIFNTVGQLVQSEQISADGNYVNSVVALNGLAEGMYNVQITVGNTVSTERMIIQK